MNDSITSNTAVSSALDAMAERSLGQIKVCIVEDDTMISEMVAAKLSSQGCIPYTIGDGSEAIKTAKHFQPDVVILDLMLPGMPGEEIIKHMKADPELQHIPVIVFSNKSERESMQTLYELGAASYFVKAMTDLNDLVAEIKALTNKQD